MSPDSGADIPARLQEIFLDALQRCAPDRLVAERLEPRAGDAGFAWLSLNPRECFNVKVAAPARLWLFGAGKAAATMAMGVLDKLGTQVHGGALIIPSETLHESMFSASLRGGKLGPLDVFEGSHPFPDEKSLHATSRLLAAARECAPDDHVIFVLSGGASALLVEPARGVSLEEKTRLLRELMERGAPIAEINAARSKLSAVKGGRLAARFPCAVTVLVLADVAPGPASLGVVGSGPFWTGAPLSAEGRIRHVLVANGRNLARAAGRAAGVLGFTEVTVEEQPVVGEVSEVAREYAQAEPTGRPKREAWPLRTKPRQDAVQPAPSPSSSCRQPYLLVRYGEPVVRGAQLGVGGRSQQLALELARELAGVPGWSFLAAGSDGIDGPTDAAGAVVDGTTWERALDLGLDPARAVEQRDAYPVLKALKALVFTGPTGNNLQDIHLLSGTRNSV